MADTEPQVPKIVEVSLDSEPVSNPDNIDVVPRPNETYSHYAYRTRREEKLHEILVSPLGNPEKLTINREIVQIYAKGFNFTGRRVSRREVKKIHAMKKGEK